jgi:hypothetical protein
MEGKNVYGWRVTIHDHVLNIARKGTTHRALASWIAWHFRLYEVIARLTFATVSACRTSLLGEICACASYATWLPCTIVSGAKRGSIRARIYFEAFIATARVAQHADSIVFASSVC